MVCFNLVTTVDNKNDIICTSMFLYFGISYSNIYFPTQCEATYFLYCRDLQMLPYYFHLLAIWKMKRHRGTDRPMLKRLLKSGIQITH